MRNSKLDRNTLIKIGRALEREFEPVTKLPLTPAMRDALVRLDLAIGSRAPARDIGKAVA